MGRNIRNERNLAKTKKYMYILHNEIEEINRKLYTYYRGIFGKIPLERGKLCVKMMKCLIAWCNPAKRTTVSERRTAIFLFPAYIAVLWGTVTQMCYIHKTLAGFCSYFGNIFCRFSLLFRGNESILSRKNKRKEESEIFGSSFFRKERMFYNGKTRKNHRCRL